MLATEGPSRGLLRTGMRERLKLLLGRDDVKLDGLDNYGRTLPWVGLNENKEVVKMLRKRGKANPDKPDRSVLTPPWWAAQPHIPGAVV